MPLLDHQGGHRLAEGLCHDFHLPEGEQSDIHIDNSFQTVQIMIGVVVFLFGIIRSINNISNYRDISVISGITYWGSLVYITAGSLSVAAQNKLHLCVVKASLVMNVFSAMTAATAIVLMSIELKLISRERCHPYSFDIDCFYFKVRNVQNYINVIYMLLGFFLKYSLGITGILLVFSILQFIISICISGFACKATHNADSTVVNVTLNQPFPYC
ncbi:membrane-spanning 4-domains, subfamily A, member 17C.1 [Ctenopharyngodon idella]|uniref:membrane-spanning 4-domains, subfamily A, member 17C.1 n=1 Tax=Ctenopharyngodon idella TaxID=7959 RepID=UPI00222EBDCB|nr:membrane-spanning 4-domains, subfamily A, member 17C.1 [Ctenopharyngodon idella]